MSGKQRRVRSLGILTFSTGDPGQFAPPWSDAVDGETWGLAVASGLPLVIGDLVQRRLSVPFTPALTAEGELHADPRFPVHRELPEVKRLADTGREMGFDRFLAGQLWPEGRPALTLVLVDCERRRETARTELALAGDDLREWAVAVVRWLAREAGLAADVTEVETGAGTAEAFALFLRAARFFHLADEHDHLRDPRHTLELLIQALESDPGYSAALASLDLFVRERLSPVSRPHLAAMAPRLREVAARAPADQGHTVLSLAATLLHVCGAEEVVPLLERPLAASFEPARMEMLARGLLLCGREPDALALAREALQREPERLALKVLLGDLLEPALRKPPVAEAQSLWQEVLAVEPDHARALEARIRGLASSDLAAATELCQRAVRVQSGSWRLLDAVVQATLQRPALAEALAAAVVPFQLAEDSSALMHGLFGSLLHLCGERDRASLHFTVALDRGLPHPYAACVHALVARPDDPAFARRADHLAYLAIHGEADAALAALQEAVQEQPDFWPFRFLLGFVEERCDHHELAREHYEAARTGSGGAAEVLYHLGLVEAKLEKWEDASGHLAAAVRRAPRQPRMWLEYARVLGQLGERDKAREAVSMVLRMRPGDAEAGALLASWRTPADAGEEAAAG